MRAAMRAAGRRGAAASALAAALAAVVLLVLAAPGAQAHAELESTTPPSGAVVPMAPDEVRLDFSESVDIAPGAVRVFDSQGRRVAPGEEARHPVGDRGAVVVELPDLDDGTYTVTFRVISADAHPVQGAFTFSVGRPSAQTSAGGGGAVNLDAGRGGSRAVGVLYGLVRTLAFLSLLVLVGGAAFLVGVWPDGWQARRARRILYAALIAAFVATVAGIGLQAVYGPGLPLADAFKPSVLRPVLRTTFGRVWLLRLVLLVAFDVVLNVFERRRPTPVSVGLGTAVGLGLLGTPGLSGHAASGDLVPLALPVDAVHLAAAALWLGGLAMLLACVLRGDPDEAGWIVPRFSRVALVCVAVIVATGSFQSWRQIRELDAFTATTYGRTLLWKLGLFAALVALAFVSRRLVRSPRPNGLTMGRLRVTVLGEAAVAVAVLVATSLLVNAVPARSALAQPATVELEAGRLVVDVTVDPAKAGPSTIHLYTLTQAGQVAEVQEATVRLTLPAKGVGPLDVPVRRAGPGHFAAYGFVIPLKGTWRLEVSVRTSEIDVLRAGASVRIR